MAKKKKRKKSLSDIKKGVSRIKKALSGPRSRKAAGRKKADSDSSAQRRAAGLNKAPDKAAPEKGKYDLGKGRYVYPRKNEQGKIEYLPKKSEASKAEKDRGLFIEDTKSNRTEEKGMSPKRDLGSGRTLYPSKNEKGKVEYLPRESEATPAEKAAGLYVPDAPSNRKIEKNMSSKRDVATGRTLYPSKNEKGKMEYLPKKEDATPTEMANGAYITAGRTIAKDKPSREDPDNNRRLYPSRNEEGEIDYLPRESEATETEKSSGRYIRDSESAWAMDNTRDPETDPDTGRLRYPAKNGDGETRYLPKESEAGPEELNRGAYVQDAETSRPALQKLRPKYDLGKGRFVYPVLGNKGKIDYLPQEQDATGTELRRGLFAYVRSEDRDDALPAPRSHIPVAPVKTSVERRAERAASLPGQRQEVEEAVTVAAKPEKDNALLQPVPEKG